MRKLPKVDFREKIKDYNEEALFIGNPNERQYDDAIIGIGRQHGGEYVLVYSETRLIEIFAAEFKANGPGGQDPWEAASEWVSTNVTDAYLGPHTPIIMPFTRGEDLE